MAFYTKRAKTKHYKKFHEKNFPFHEVIEVISSVKSYRRKGDKLIIETDNAYIVCKLKKKTLYIINAKRK